MKSMAMKKWLVPVVVAVLSLVFFQVHAGKSEIITSLPEKTKADRERTKEGFKELFNSIKQDIKQGRKENKEKLHKIKAEHAEKERERQMFIAKVKSTSQPVAEGVYLASSEKSRSGYSQHYTKVRSYIEKGHFDDIETYYDEYYQGIRDRYGEDQTGYLVDPTKDLLRINERASAFLYEGDYDRAINAFSLSEELVYRDVNKKNIWKSFNAGMLRLGEVTSGNEELRPYKGEGWERVLVLNYKAISHLLTGDRKAYNVTRRAIDLQNHERDIFKNRVQKAEAKLAKENEKLKRKGYAAFGAVLDDVISDVYKESNIKAQNVESGYVNPLGFYIAGMIQEYDAHEDDGLTSNALISYRKANEIFGGNKFIEKIITALDENGINRDRQTIHILFANGYVPEKKVVTTRFVINDLIVPVNVPVYEPIRSSVHSVEIYAGGTRIGRMSKIADLESLCLRQQKDAEPFFRNRVRIASGRALFGKKLAKLFGAFGEGLNEDIEEVTPDLRSWLSLPKEVLAARLKVSKNMRSIKIVAKNASKKTVYSKTIKLSRDHANFVFARGLNHTLYAFRNNDHWIKL